MAAVEETPQVAADEVKEESTEVKTEVGSETAPTTASSDSAEKYADDETFKSLMEKNLKKSVAILLMGLFEDKFLESNDFDERAVEMLNGFPEDQGRYFLEQIRATNPFEFGIQSRSLYVMSLMRNFRDRVRQLGRDTVLSTPLVHGPERESLKAILDRTGYSLELSVGQRKYGGPPPDWEGPGPSGQGHELYVGHIPNELYEDALIPILEEYGKIWDLRLMMDPMSGKSRGYAFLTYCDKESTAKASKELDGREIAPGKTLKVNVSVANTRLFVANIPKSKSKDEILEELKQHTEGVTDVIIYSVTEASDRYKNRGFCFVDFVDHKTASDVKRKMQQHKIRLWNTDLAVDWAEQQEEPDEETMSKVKVLYVRGLKEAVTDEKLKELLTPCGEIERVKRVKDYAFVHFMEREGCMKALEEFNGKEIEGNTVECSLAKPQGDRKKMNTRGRGMGFVQGFGGQRGRGRGMGANTYPNYGGPGGYGDYYSGYGDMGYGNYGGYSGGGYGDYAAQGGFQPYGGGYGGVYGGGYNSPQGNPRGGFRGGRGGTPGGPRGAGGRGGYGGGRGYTPGFGKRRGEHGGGPAVKRENGGQDYSADVSMSF